MWNGECGMRNADLLSVDGRRWPQMDWVAGRLSKSPPRHRKEAPGHRRQATGSGFGLGCVIAIGKLTTKTPRAPSGDGVQGTGCRVKSHGACVMTHGFGFCLSDWVVGPHLENQTPRLQGHQAEAQVTDSGLGSGGGPSFETLRQRRETRRGHVGSRLQAGGFRIRLWIPH
jgi:hypothetical protein